jgi:excisionase family DNA binding protein
VSALADTLIRELDDSALAELAERLRPFLTRHVAELLAPAAAAALLGVHPKTLTRAAAAGRVSGAVRVGRAWRFRPAELALEPPVGVTPTLAPSARPRQRATTTTTASAIRGSAR